MKHKSMIKATVVAVIVSFLLPSLMWAFEQPALSLASHDLLYLNKPLRLPARWGHVKQAVPGHSKTVIGIEDLHCNYEVQKNIARIIQHLRQHWNATLVMEEGAANKVNLQWWQAFPGEGPREDVADYFMRQGKLSGAEYAALKDPALHLSGLENKALYDQSLQLAKGLLNSETQGIVYDLRDALGALKPRIYNQNLQRLDHLVMAYRQGNLQLTAYAARLAQKARSLGVTLKAYPALTSILQPNRSAVSSLGNPEDLFDTLRALENIVRQRLYTGNSQRRLDELWQRLDVMEKLCNISVTRKELDRFLDDRQAFKVDKITAFLKTQGLASAIDPEWKTLDQRLDEAERFYHLADQRSRLFVASAISRMEEDHQSLGVMVLGGFHTAEVIKQLQAKGVGCITIRPALTRYDVLNPYFELLQGRQTPLEKLLASRQTLLRLWTNMNRPAFQAQARLLMVLAAQAQDEDGRRLKDYMAGHPRAAVVLLDAHALKAQGLQEQPQGVRIFRTALKTKSGAVLAVVMPRPLANRLNRGGMQSVMLRHQGIIFYARTDQLREAFNRRQPYRDLAGHGWDALKTKLAQWWRQPPEAKGTASSQLALPAMLGLAAGLAVLAMAQGHALTGIDLLGPVVLSAGWCLPLPFMEAMPGMDQWAAKARLELALRKAGYTNLDNLIVAHILKGPYRTLRLCATSLSGLHQDLLLPHPELIQNQTLMEELYRYYTFQAQRRFQEDDQLASLTVVGEKPQDRLSYELALDAAMAQTAETRLLAFRLGAFGLTTKKKQNIKKALIAYLQESAESIKNRGLDSARAVMDHLALTPFAGKALGARLHLEDTWSEAAASYALALAHAAAALAIQTAKQQKENKAIAGQDLILLMDRALELSQDKTCGYEQMEAMLKEVLLQRQKGDFNDAMAFLNLYYGLENTDYPWISTPAFLRAEMNSPGRSLGRRLRQYPYHLAMTLAGVLTAGLMMHPIIQASNWSLSIIIPAVLGGAAVGLAFWVLLRLIQQGHNLGEIRRELDNARRLMPLAHEFSGLSDADRDKQARKQGIDLNSLVYKQTVNRLKAGSLFYEIQKWLQQKEHFLVGLASKRLQSPEARRQRDELFAGENDAVISHRSTDKGHRSLISHPPNTPILKRRFLLDQLPLVRRVLLAAGFMLFTLVFPAQASGPPQPLEGFSQSRALRDLKISYGLTSAAALRRDNPDNIMVKDTSWTGFLAQALALSQPDNEFYLTPGLRTWLTGDALSQDQPLASAAFWARQLLLLSLEHNTWLHERTLLRQADRGSKGYDRFNQALLYQPQEQKSDYGYHKPHFYKIWISEHHQTRTITVVNILRLIDSLWYWSGGATAVSMDPSEAHQLLEQARASRRYMAEPRGTQALLQTLKDEKGLMGAILRDYEPTEAAELINAEVLQTFITLQQQGPTLMKAKRVKPVDEVKTIYAVSIDASLKSRLEQKLTQLDQAHLRADLQPMTGFLRQVVEAMTSDGRAGQIQPLALNDRQLAILAGLLDELGLSQKAGVVDAGRDMDGTVVVAAFAGKQEVTLGHAQHQAAFPMPVIGDAFVKDEITRMRDRPAQVCALNTIKGIDNAQLESLPYDQMVLPEGGDWSRSTLWGRVGFALGMIIHHLVLKLPVSKSLRISWMGWLDAHLAQRSNPSAYLSGVFGAMAQTPLIRNLRQQGLPMESLPLWQELKAPNSNTYRAFHRMSIQPDNMALQEAFVHGLFRLARYTADEAIAQEEALKGWQARDVERLQVVLLGLLLEQMPSLASQPDFAHPEERRFGKAPAAMDITPKDFDLPLPAVVIPRESLQRRGLPGERGWLGQLSVWLQNIGFAVNQDDINRLIPRVRQLSLSGAA